MNLIDRANKNKREVIKEELEKLPQKNIDFFLRVYKNFGDSVDEIFENAPSEKLDVMARQIQNTQE